MSDREPETACAYFFVGGAVSRRMRSSLQKGVPLAEGGMSSSCARSASSYSHMASSDRQKVLNPRISMVIVVHRS